MNEGQTEKVDKRIFTRKDEHGFGVSGTDTNVM